jgi:membrane fusion protein, copper/silver efflux system
MNTSRNTFAGILLAALVLIGIGAAGGYWLARRSDGDTAQGMGSSPPSSTAGRDGKPLYWYDPMVPNQHFDKPGKSPFMDMQLVPKYTDEEAEGGGIHVRPDMVQNLGIRLGHVERTRLDSELHAVGSVAFDERLLQLVQARVDGYVTASHVKAPFEQVHRGQALAEILAPQWLESEQQFISLLETNADPSGALRRATRERLTVLGVPDETIRQLEATRTPNATTTIYAPIDGVVTELNARAGSAFMAGASLFRINGLKTVWVNAQIPEANVSSATAGSTVEGHATAWPGKAFSGQVIALLPDVDPQTRTLTARVAIDNEGFQLSPGMYVTLDFRSSPNEPQLVVPSEAVIATGERRVVIIARPRGGFDVANVTTAAERNGRTVILSGLTEGESIVLSGQFLIDSEASLTATVSRLQSTSSPGTKP